MKGIVLFVLFQLTSLSIYCQKTYPQKIVFDSDTATVITIDQVKAINITYSDLEYFKDAFTDCMNYNDSLYQVIDMKDTLYYQLRRITNIQDSVIDNNVIEIDACRCNLFEERDLNVKIKRQRNILFGLSGILFVILLL